MNFGPDFKKVIEETDFQRKKIHSHNEGKEELKVKSTGMPM